MVTGDIWGASIDRQRTVPSRIEVAVDAYAVVEDAVKGEPQAGYRFFGG
jgi:hypothetical protein